MAKEKPTKKICKYCKTVIDYKAKVCPQCRKKQGGSAIKTILIVLGVIILLSIIFVGGNDEEKASNADQVDTSVDSTEDKEEIIYTQYSVSQMMSELDSNPLKAEKTYSDAYVEITGRLNVIDSDGSYISLVPEDDEWAIMGITCYIKNDKQLEQVMEMSIDDTVTLRGQITSIGEILGYSLDIDEIL